MNVQSNILPDALGSQGGLKPVNTIAEMASSNLFPVNQQPTLLVVDGDNTASESLKKNLQRENYQVITAGSGLEAIQVAFANRPDLMLLEIELPDISGFEVCRSVRPQLILPILILTSRTEEVDKVLGLELGADDYLTKPFSWRELLARVHAQLRRVELGRSQRNQNRTFNPLSNLASSPRLIIDELNIQLAQRSVTKAGLAITMTPKEFELLAFLALHPRQVFSRQELLSRVWGNDALSNAKTVDVHVRWLRAKLEEDPANPRLIQTVYGIGYKLASG